MWNRPLVLVCATGLGFGLLAGCGSSSSETTSTASGSPMPSASSPAASPSTYPASLPQLKEIVLQAADLPTGWKGTPHKADPSAAADQAALVKCVGGRNTDPDKVAEAHSEDFALGDASASSSASTYRSQSDVDADVAMLHSPKLSPCFDKMVRKELATSLPAGATIESAAIKITPGSAGGPANVIATGTGTIKVRLDGQQLAFYLSVAYITGPLIEAEVDIFNVGTPVPASQVMSLVAAVATRAAQG